MDINGVTVLNVEEVMVCDEWFILFAVIFVVSLLLFLCSLALDSEVFFEISGSLTFVAAIGLILVVCINTNSGKYKYDCLIDDTASMTEICEQYNVVRQSGKVWVLQDKEVKDNE